MVHVRVDLSSLVRFRETVQADLRGSGSGPIRDGLRQWAAIYRGYLQERFDRLSKSGGGGEWPPLKASTIAARRSGKSAGRFKRGDKTATQRQRTRFLQSQIDADNERLGKISAKMAGLRAKGKGSSVQHVKAAAQFAKTAEKTDARAAKNAKEIRAIKGGKTVSILRDTGTLFMALSPQFGGKPGQLQEDIPFGVRVGYGGPARHPDGTMTIADLAEAHDTGAGHLPVRRIVVDPDAKALDLMARTMQEQIDKLGDGRP